ncbi:MAG: NAD-dependent epimerase/dehydratase family protein [Alphaproteobacteria bacterium]|nr:NAD-dependent epimerase/dehydratase family protein [Alphaproteobacteria bacterium]
MTVDFESLRGRRVLVTGGLGFIGSNLARRLVELGADVVLVDSLIPEYGGNLFNVAGIEDRARVNISDVRDVHAFRHLVRDRELLFNLAGQTSHLDSMRDPVADLEINCAAQLNMLETCRRHAPGIKIVFASTRQIYGRPDYLPVDEKHILRPADVNGINKMAGEWYHILYNNVHGLKATALRLTNTFGPRMRVKDARQTFLGVWIKAVVRDEPFEVWGGQQLRDFSYVEDCVDALLAAATTDAVDGRFYNLAGDRVISLHDLAELLVEVAGGGRYEIKAFPPERKKIDIGDYYAEDTAFRTTTGWQARTRLGDGLAATLAFYRQNIDRYL